MAAAPLAIADAGGVGAAVVAVPPGASDATGLVAAAQEFHAAAKELRLAAVKKPSAAGLGAATTYDEFLTLRAQHGESGAGSTGGSGGFVSAERIRATRRLHPEFEIRQGWDQIAVDLEAEEEESIEILRHFRERIE